MTTVGVLHPGAMGSAIGGALHRGGADVVWVSEGRSAETAARAAAGGFRDGGTLSALGAVDVVVSVCPPDAARAVAEAVAATDFGGVYLDANATSPTTAAAVDNTVTAAGVTFVDGSIIGGPQAPRLYLCGEAAHTVVGLFASPVSVEVLDGPKYAASSLKMIYAGWTKGTSALLLALAAAAEGLGVSEAIRAEWGRSQPALLQRLEAAGAPAAKAWRWSGEMREIAGTLAQAGLPPSFHDAAAEVYERLAPLKDDPAVDPHDIAHILLEPWQPRP